MGTSDRKPYETATVLDQDFLDECQDNLTCNLELIVDIERPDSGFIRASDRNKYVGSTFYEALLNFPVIRRTVGEFLNNRIEFSTLTLEINNVDGRFNDILPAGANFGGWIGKSVEVKLGLRDVASTYTSIFKGFVTEEGGFSRDVGSITLVARDQFDKVNQTFPNTLFDTTTFPDLENSLENQVIPVIYGDWTTDVEPNSASIPAFIVNGADADVNGSTSNTTNVQLVISENDNKSFDTTEVYLVRGDFIYTMDSADVVNVSSNRTFELRQSATTPSGTTLIDGSPFDFSQGDKFFVKVVGKDLGVYTDNIVSIARDLLITYGGLVAGDFDSNWDTFRDKASPTESAISTFKARLWAQEQGEALTVALSLLEQVRLESFIDRNLKFKIMPLHFDEFDDSPSFPVRNWDVERGTYQLGLDDRNNFNRAKGVFNFLPNRDENFNETAIYKNDAAITQAGKQISKAVIYPNLYTESVVIDQLSETLKLTSGYIEHVNVNLTWRSLLLDIGEFVKLNVSIQGTQFTDVPALIREIGYDPSGLKVPVKFWSFQLLPFGSYNPGFSGITGGESATITKE